MAFKTFEQEARERNAQEKVGQVLVFLINWVVILTIPVWVPIFLFILLGVNCYYDKANARNIVKGKDFIFNTEF